MESTNHLVQNNKHGQFIIIAIIIIIIIMIIIIVSIIPFGVTISKCGLKPSREKQNSNIFKMFIWFQFDLSFEVVDGINIAGGIMCW